MPAPTWMLPMSISPRLQQTFDPTLDLFADILLNPSFPRNEFDRLKKEHLDRIDQEKSQPFGMALRVFPKLLYGQGHAYGNPISGSGYESTVNSITPGRNPEVLQYLDQTE